jgi:hypothetical protein
VDTAGHQFDYSSSCSFSAALQIAFSMLLIAAADNSA